MSIFTFEGAITDSITSAPLENLRVDVYSGVQIGTDPLAKFTTDIEGTFVAVLDIDALVAADRLPGSSVASAYFRIFEHDIEVLNTRAQPWPFDAPTTQGSYVVDRKVTGHIHGTVADNKTGPIANAAVTIVRRLLDGGTPVDVELVATTSDARGRYRVSYTTNDGRPVNLFAKASTAAGTAIQSELVCNAPPVLTIDLIGGGDAWRGATELERLLDAISREVANDRLAGLTPEAVALLACASGQSAEHLTLLVAAQRSAAATGLSVDLFYGMARFGVGPDLHGVLAHTVLARRRAFDQALDANTVRCGEGNTVAALMVGLTDALYQFSLTEVSQPGRAAVYDIIKTSLAAAASHTPFLQRYAARTQQGEAFWSSLEIPAGTTPSADAQTIANNLPELKLAFTISSLLGGFLALQQKLGQLRAAGGFPTLRDMANISWPSWNGWVEEAISGGAQLPPNSAGKTGADAVVLYVDTVVADFDELFPSEVLRRSFTSSAVLSAPTTTFINNTPSFDLFHTDVDKFIAAGDAAAIFAGIPAADQATAIAEVKAIKRIGRLANKVPAVAKQLYEKG
ncbi:MAG TPA: carboxypeptidase regulatory-like domain-containing protein, partial [Sorangium sp.]|nr:carboxypeptidase regulatory-like domain-containing protein [Sorangium sp.]